MKYTKENIIREYKKLRIKIGRPPDSKMFYRESPISRRAAELAFGSQTFSKIQQAAGDKPRQFRTPGRSTDEFFEKYGKVIRELQIIPTEADWNHRRIKPTPSGYRKKLGFLWSQLPHAFRKWAIDKTEWEDVVQICDANCQSQSSIDDEPSGKTCGYVYMIKSGRFYKIGRTKSPGRRSYEVALQLPEEIKKVHLIKTDDPAGVEAYWHNRFKEKRERGEFFELSSDDVRAFKRWKSIW